MKIEPGCISWNWEGKEIRVGYDRVGVGPQVLLLPALSSISTRREMQPLQERLACPSSSRSGAGARGGPLDITFRRLKEIVEGRPALSP